MKDFLYIILSFPTVGFTIFLGFVVVYWLFVLLGALDLDLFDLDADIDADVDLDLDMDVDVDVDADLDVDADIDADVDADADLDVDGGGIGGAIVAVLSALGWVGVPLTITISFFSLLNWVCTFLGAYFMAQWLGEAYSPIVKVGLFFASIVVSTGATSLAIKPLKGVFRSAVARSGARGFIGKTIKITSGTVGPHFGRGAFDEEDGAVMDLSIRCEDPNNGLERGDEALIIDYDEERHIYFVEPMGHMLNSTKRDDDLEVVFDEMAKKENATSKA